MQYKNYELFKTRRFVPIFLTQFLGALNDNLFRNSLLIYITFVLVQQNAIEKASGELFVSAAIGIFILPFFIFSAFAGQLADKFEKSGLIRRIKEAELLIVLIAVIGFYQQSLPLLLIVLFLLGTQSAFFGPIKYSILPEHLKPNELVSGNGFIESTTFIAILLGTIIGGLLIVQNVYLVDFLLVAIAIFGIVAGYNVPKAPSRAEKMKLNFNIFAETIDIMAYTYRQKQLLLPVLAISWFWFIGAVFLSQLSPFVAHYLNGDEKVVTLLLSVFSVGIAIGSVFCNRLLRGRVVATYVPLSALMIAIFSFDIYFTSVDNLAILAANPVTYHVGNFFSSSANVTIAFDLFFVSFFGGIYSVPLYAMVQNRAAASHRARVIASLNIYNSLFMVASSIVSIAMLAVGFSIAAIFLVIAILNLVVAIYICKLLPDAIIVSIFSFIFKVCFRLEVKGLENYDLLSKRAIIVANHTSFIDALLLAVVFPERLYFAVNTHIAKKWWVKFALNFVTAFPIDPTNPLSTKHLINAVKEGKKLVIFPEGRITVTGALMKIYEGPAMIADKAEADILPVRIDGAQRTYFSRLGAKAKRKWFPKITITILEPKQISIKKNVFGRKRRHVCGERLLDIMSDLIFQTEYKKEALFRKLINRVYIETELKVIAEDVNRKPISYREFMIKTLVIAKRLKRIAAKGEYVGMLLPNMVNSCLTFFALQYNSMIPCMLNYATGSNNVITSCKIAKLRLVLTSRRFVQLGKLQPTIELLEANHIKIIYLEDLLLKISAFEAVLGFLTAGLAKYCYRDPNPDSPAVVLFTSGSEGVPKGVVLSHSNIIANISQLGSRVDFNSYDIVFNAMPIFHSFGLSAGMLLPILSGIKVFFYPSPLHYRIIPELVYDTNATILFGTDSFLTSYANYAHPYDFYSLRYVFSGAERLKDETKKVWSEKFGVRIFEGYGATETSPVLTTNTAMLNKAGTVGRFLPGITYEIEKVEGVVSGGRLFVAGPNIMVGYMKIDNPGVIQPPVDGIYDTGDIVNVDSDGFVKILGRAKRFAKIAGEMVSLGQVEEYLSELWPNNQHAIIVKPDAKKGEQLLLITNYEEATREAIVRFVKERGYPEISVPKQIKVIKELPLLGTGKVDYQALTGMLDNR